MSASNTLQELGQRIVKKVRNALFLGPANMKEHYEKTGGFGADVVGDYIRRKPKWEKKGKGKWKSTSSSVPFEIDPQYIIKDDAREAALALVNRTGNCREMANLSLYYFTEYYQQLEKSKNTEALQKIDSARISRIRLPEPFDHTLLKIEIPEVRDTQNLIIQAKQVLYLDAWAGFAYDASDFKKPLEKTLDNLIESAKFAFVENLRLFHPDVVEKFKKEFNLDPKEDPADFQILYEKLAEHIKKIIQDRSPNYKAFVADYQRLRNLEQMPKMKNEILSNPKLFLKIAAEHTPFTNQNFVKIYDEVNHFVAEELDVRAKPEKKDKALLFEGLEKSKAYKKMQTEGSTEKSPAGSQTEPAKANDQSQEQPKSNQTTEPKKF